MPDRPASILFCIREKSRLGFMDASGRVVIEPRFQNDLYVEHHEGAVDFADWVPVKVNQRWGFIDARGDFKLEPRFELVRPFSEDLAPVGEIVDRSYGVPQGKWGYMDRSGRLQVEAAFGNAGGFKGGLAVVNRPQPGRPYSEYTGGYGIIDRSGRFVVPPEFERIFEASEGLAMTWKTPKAVGFLDEAGAVALPFVYSAAGHFTRGHAKAEQGSRRGVIDRRGNFVFWSETPVPGNRIYGFHCTDLLCQPAPDGPVLDAREGRCGYRDFQGHWVVEPRYDDAVPFAEGRAAVKVGKLWGFIDGAGELVIPPRFQEPSYFSEGLAQVKVKLRSGGKTVSRSGFVDRRGEWVIEPRFTKADERCVRFRHGLAAVILDKRRAWIDPRGRVVWHEAVT
jgi:hypothetical protein